MIRAAAFIPKVLIALIILGILYELPWKTSDLEIPTKSWLKDTIKEHATLLLGDNAITSITDTPPAEPEHANASASAAPSAAALPVPPVEPEQEHADDTAAPTIDWNKIHVSYGNAKCMPDFDDKQKKLALERRASCSQHAPFPSEESRRVAFATISTGKRIPAYDGAIQTQMLHAAVHVSSSHILCDDLAPGAWNKIAYLQYLVLAELLKPEDERLEWIMWIDRDAIVLDACRPLSSFLPPNSSEYDKYNILTDHDMNGLNAGVFIFRVNQWSSLLFSAIMAYPIYNPDVGLAYAEQTAMALVLASDKWKGHEARVPQHWFNSYPDGDQSVPAFMSGVERPNMESWRVRRGDFALHFAGNQQREQIMLDWYDVLAKAGNVWETSVTRDITAEIKQYWDNLGKANNGENKKPQKEEGNDGAGDAKDSAAVDENESAKKKEHEEKHKAEQKENQANEQKERMER
ncbi:hypothetical protein CFE70_001172 [Pyrenophora teres f. teres 0-1]|uniref:Galactosyl transferase GMA12-MNN10 family protein n=1 Tax=Pyrenophora teres f. teres (strain 0-1) TaxID=861557 RepID=E3S487_PYRTT|nr:hypothetical protein PTT_17341 [Pyrenophora teres f. teres 0-1]